MTDYSRTARGWWSRGGSAYSVAHQRALLQGRRPVWVMLRREEANAPCVLINKHMKNPTAEESHDGQGGDRAL